MNSARLSLAALVFAGMVQSIGAQSTGGFTSPSTGAAAAGASPVGMVLPYTVQAGSTAPTQPGRTIPPVGWTHPSAPVPRAAQGDERVATEHVRARDEALVDAGRADQRR